MCHRAPALLGLHGGGMVVGTPQFETLGFGRLARELGAVVVAPDYRLAPEHRFPAGLDDCMATLYWMRGHASNWGSTATVSPYWAGARVVDWPLRRVDRISADSRPRGSGSATSTSS